MAEEEEEEERSTLSHTARRVGGCLLLGCSTGGPVPYVGHLATQIQRGGDARAARARADRCAEPRETTAPRTTVHTRERAATTVHRVCL